MLARLQQSISLSLLFLTVAWATWFVSVGKPAWALCGAVVILFGYAIFLAAEFAMLYYVQTDQAAPRPSLGQLALAWWGEVLMAPRVFLWRQPFRSNAEADWLPTCPNGRRGVVLVHGFVCNRGLWNPWMRALRARGIPFVAVNLEPVFGSIDGYAEIIESAVSRVEAATGMPTVVVGHSMGGVALRAWHAAHGTEGRLHRAITIGSPHHGTWLARFGRTANGHEMRMANPWLARLAARETAEHYARFICFFGHCDNIVFPSSSAILRGALNVHVPATAHVHMVFRTSVFEAVCATLE